MQTITYFPPWIRHMLACMGGCLGSSTKPRQVIAVDKPSNGLKFQDKTVTDDFWSTSTYDMDISAVPSQRSFSSVSMFTPTLDPNTSAGSTSNPSEFVNHGLILWNQTRQQWIGNKKLHNRKQVREPRLSWNATYQNLLGTNKPFQKSVPLPEMVEFLVDIWDQEGLYD